VGNFFERNTKWRNWNDLKTSITFWKTVAGFIVGGIVGSAVEYTITNKK